MSILLQASDLDDFAEEKPVPVPAVPLPVAQPDPPFVPDGEQAVEVPPAVEEPQPTSPPETTETPAENVEEPAPGKQPPTQEAVLAEITQQDKVAQEAKMRWLSAQERVKGARESAKALQEVYLGEMARLHEIIQGHRNDSDRPLFADAACDEGAVEECEECEGSEGCEGEAAQPDAWRDAALEVLNLKPALHAKLLEHDVTTIGKLEDLRASFDGLKSIKGIGQGKADQIEDAVLDWLTKNRDSEILKDRTSITLNPTPEQAAELKKALEESPETGEIQILPMPNVRPTVLAARLNDLRQESHAVLKHQDAWQAGVLARSEGKGVESCEENEAERIDDWIRGWLAQDSNS